MREQSKIDTRPVCYTFPRTERLTNSFVPVLFVDLIQHYDRILPPTIVKKKRESERKVPQRKRTAMVDMRMRRSNIGEVTDLKEAIIHQSTRRTGPGSRSSISTTTGPPESVKALSAGQDNKANVPAILRVGGGAANTSQAHPAPAIVAPNPTLAFATPPPPPPLEAQVGFVTPPPPSGFVPPPPPPPLIPGHREDVSFPEQSNSSYSDNIPAPEGYVPPPMPSFRDPSDAISSRTSPTLASDPPSRSSSPAIGGHRPGPPPRGTPGLRGPRTGGLSIRGARTSGVPPPPGRRESYGQHNQQFRPQTPPSPNNFRGSRPTSQGSYNPSAHRRSGSGSGFSRRTMASDAEVN